MLSLPRFHTKQEKASSKFTRPSPLAREAPAGLPPTFRQNGKLEKEARQKNLAAPAGNPERRCLKSWAVAAKRR